MSSPIDTASVLIVPELSGFGRALQSGIDNALRQLKVQIGAAFDSIERSAHTSGMDVGQEFQRGGEHAEAAFRELKNTANTQFAEIRAGAAATGDGMSSRLTGALAMVKTALLGLGVAAGAGLVALTGFGLKSAAGIEQTTIGLQALTGSAQNAQVFLAQLQQFAAATPFEFAGVADASRRILAFGQSVGITRDQVIPTLTTIGDLVSVLGGTQENVDSVVRALGQMASKGKLSQEELMQLAEALPGFNANAAVATATGHSVADTLSLITAGGIDATTGINALLAGMKAFPGAAGAMAAQSQTLLGVFSTFKDTVGIALTNAFQPVIPGIKTALSELTPVIGSAIGQLAPSLGGALSKLLPLVGKLIEAIVPILSPILDALGPALDALGPALVPLGEAIGQVLVALGPVLPVLAEFIAVLAELAVPILKLVAAVLTPLTPILNYMALAIGEVARALAMIDWTAVGAAIAAFVTDAWNKTFEMFSKIASAVSTFKDNFILGFQLVRDAVVGKIEEVVAFVTGLPGRILDALGSFGSLLVDQGRALITGLWNGISAMGGWLWNQVTSFLYNNTVGAAKKILGISSPSTVFAEQIGSQIPAGIAQGVQAGIGNLQGMLSPIVPGANAAGGVATAAGAGAGMNFGGIVVNVNFVGVVPTADEARRTGQQAGDGIMQAIARRNVGLAVRMGVSG